MKGLILKDIINMKGQAGLYLAITALWLGVGYFNENPAFFAGVMQMLIIMIPLVSLAYDERSKWERFAVTMPVSRKQLVISKYVFFIIVAAVVAVIAAVGGVIIGGEPDETVLLAFAAVPLGMILNGIIMPVLLKFGVEKGRFVFLGVIAVPVLGVFLLGRIPAVDRLMETEIPGILSQGAVPAMAAFWAIGFVIAAVSLVISIKIYERKEF